MGGAMSQVSNVDVSAVAQKLGGQSAINGLVDVFYDNILSDYRINRIFNDDNPEQRAALKKLMAIAMSGASCADKNLMDLIDQYFVAAFARSKRQSFVNGSDFNFLGMVADQDQPNPNPLCDSHQFLLKFIPDDSHYDAVLENLASALAAIGVNDKLAADVLALAESIRDKALGR
jgi:hemoglobin